MNPFPLFLLSFFHFVQKETKKKTRIYHLYGNVIQYNQTPTLKRPFLTTCSFVSSMNISNQKIYVWSFDLEHLSNSIGLFVHSLSFISLPSIFHRKIFIFDWNQSIEKSCKTIFPFESINFVEMKEIKGREIKLIIR